MQDFAAPLEPESLPGMKVQDWQALLAVAQRGPCADSDRGKKQQQVRGDLQTVRCMWCCMHRGSCSICTRVAIDVAYCSNCHVCWSGAATTTHARILLPSGGSDAAAAEQGCERCCQCQVGPMI
jgi:hypothetical protein